jgi:ABC-type dipeptide/oligopeptide/nickel transport system permease component
VALTQAVPDYVLGLLGALLFFYVLRILPAPIGQIGLTVAQPTHITGAAFLDALLSGNGAALSDAFGHLVLPVLALGIANSVVFARVTRSTMATALETAHVEFARAQGLSEWRVVRQAFRASKIPVITYSATVAAGLVGGDAIIEQVFNWQGIGQWAVTGLLNDDLPVVQGFVLLSGSITLLAYLIADLLVLKADPRIRRPFGADS